MKHIRKVTVAKDTVAMANALGDIGGWLRDTVGFFFKWF